MWLAESYFVKWRLKHNKEKRILMQKQKLQERGDYDVVCPTYSLTTLCARTPHSGSTFWLNHLYLLLKNYVFKTQGYFNRSCERPWSLQLLLPHSSTPIKRCYGTLTKWYSHYVWRNKSILPKCIVSVSKNEEHFSTNILENCHLNPKPK